MKRVTPEIMQNELNKLNQKIEQDFTSLIDKETKKIENRLTETQKGYQEFKNK